MRSAVIPRGAYRLRRNVIRSTVNHPLSLDVHRVEEFLDALGEGPHRDDLEDGEFAKAVLANLTPPTE